MILNKVYILIQSNIEIDFILIIILSYQTDTMSTVMPYIGLEEISSDKVGTAKALVAELLGTLILVSRSYFGLIMTLMATLQIG